ncbi:MAG: NUMOD3 domain-containing DNA-binding protein, partial [Thermoproteota archaeon]|nr:NUMOD3 domain-containing DNA-binding protein [Thermoproteota archaeon]
GQAFAKDTVFADGQEFEGDEDYDFDAEGLEFGSGTKFGRAEEFGMGAEFDDGAVDFYGTNTFGTGTKFASGQDFDAPQVFGANLDFADDMKFADGQEFHNHIYEFDDDLDFGADTEFAVGQDFEGDIEFTGVFDYYDMKGKSLEFKGDVDFYMPPAVLIGDEYYTPPLAIPPGTTFGDEFDYEDMYSDEDGDGVNDEYYVFEPGVKFAADTKFPPMVEFAEGFSKDDMMGKEFTFNEGVFFAGDPVFPAGQKIKPGVMWDEPPTFEAGVDIDPGLALPAGTTFSPDLELPAFVAAPYGLVLAPVTCEDTDCVPDPDAYLEPGELLPPGIDPPPVVNFITGTNKTFANPGLGFEMAFDKVAKDGKVKVDLQDPVKVPGTTEGDGTGQRAMTSGSGIFQNVGSIIDVSVDTASASGAMTVTLPYDESILGTASEDEIVLLHYTGGKWVTVDNITIDKANNKVSGTVNSLSPFTVGKQTGTVSTGGTSVGESTGAAGGSGGAVGGGGGGGGGSIISGEGAKAEYPSLRIVEVSYDTNADIMKITVAPEYEKTDVIITTATGFALATKIGTHPILNQAIYEVPLFADSGPLQVSATAFVKSLVIEATPLVTTISAGTTTIKSEEGEEPPVIITTPEDFQKPDDFITEIQCPFGTNLIDGKCVSQTLQEQPFPIQFVVILLLVMLAIGLALTVEMRRRKARKIVASQLLFETEEVIRPPSITEPKPPVIIPQELEQEKSDLIELSEILQAQEAIQKKLHLLETQLLENVKQEAEIRERLTILVKLVEIRINLVEPLSTQYLKALPQPKRTYKKKKKVLTVEHKAKIAAARKGKKQSEITKQKIAESRTGKKMSESTKQKISKTRKTKKEEVPDEA